MFYAPCKCLILKSTPFSICEQNQKEALTQTSGMAESLICNWQLSQALVFHLLGLL